MSQLAIKMSLVLDDRAQLTKHNDNIHETLEFFFTYNFKNSPATSRHIHFQKYKTVHV
jgi:hypothetical protein